MDPSQSSPYPAKEVESNYQDVEKSQQYVGKIEQ
jgi:hypothetical protein